MISLLFSLSLNPAWAGLSEVANSNGATAATTPSNTCAPALSAPDIDKCLEDQLRKKVEAKKAAEAAAKEAKKNQPPGQPQPPTPPAYPFHQVSSSELPPSCAGDDLDKFKQALTNIQKFCASPKSAQNALNGPMQLGCRVFTRDEYCTQTNAQMLALANAKGATMASVTAAAKTQFDWYANGPAGKDGQPAPPAKFQYTGYYGAELDARRPPCSTAFPYPVYKTPSDLRNFASKEPELNDANVPGRPANCGTHPITGEAITTCRSVGDGTYVPYYTREEIAAHALNGKGAEIGCVANPIDIAFFQIQGDGQMYIKNDAGKVEEVWRLNSGEANGRSGYLLGNVVRCAGGVINSMTSIRTYLEAHKCDMLTVMNRNPSYMFFDQVKGGEPKGSEGISLVEGHSIATDRRFIRLGAQTMFDIPSGTGANVKHDCALANAMDQGSAISNMHADRYFGEGQEAFKKADALNANGALFIAVPKGAGKPVPNCQ